jgi:hypothetical protein
MDLMNHQQSYPDFGIFKYLACLKSLPLAQQYGFNV